MAKNNRNNKNKHLKPVTPSIDTNKIFATFEKTDSRKDKNKEVGKQILILCEGETEENYFEGISNTYIFRQQPFVPTIVCPPTKKIGEEGDRKNQPINLLATIYEFLKITKKIRNKEFEDYCDGIKIRQKQPEMQERRKRQGKKPKTNFDLQDNQTIQNIQSQIGNGMNPIFDELWLVFDDDDRTASSTTFHQIFYFAQLLDIQIAFSNRQWENWILLHFERTLHISNNSGCKFACATTCHLVTNPACNCMIGYLTGRKYYSNYRKGHWKYTPRRQKTNEYGFEGLFEIDFTINSTHKMSDEEIVYDKIYHAIENAQWLRQEKRENIPTTSSNPYTDVDKLISRLIGNDKVYIWGTAANIAFKHLSLSNISFNRATSKLLITIENNNTSYHLVNENIRNEFCLISILPNFKREKYDAIHINRNRALSNNSENFEIDFGPISPNIIMTLRFIYQVEQNVILVTDL